MHEVENWKQYNREDFKIESKKNGCVCAIFWEIWISAKQSEKRIKNNKKSATFTKIIRKRIKNEGKKEDKIRSNLGYFYEVNILTARENPKVIPKYQKIPSFLAVKLINSMGENPCNLSITRISKIKRNKVQMVFILEKGQISQDSGI